MHCAFITRNFLDDNGSEVWRRSCLGFGGDFPSGSSRRACAFDVVEC